jgi:5-methylcytosine-specific restriction endonuclease McrA
VAKQLPIPCSLCGDPITHLGHDRMSLTFDHIVPVSLGGTNELENLRPAHKGCNSPWPWTDGGVGERVPDVSVAPGGYALAHPSRRLYESERFRMSQSHPGRVALCRSG